MKKILLLSVIVFLSLFSSQQSFSQSVTGNQWMKVMDTLANPLSRILQLQPVSYRYNVQSYPDIRLPRSNQYGFLPASVSEAFPELVNTQRFSFLAGKNNRRELAVEKVNSEHLLAFLVAAVQQQHAEIQTLKQQIKILQENETEGVTILD